MYSKGAEFGSNNAELNLESIYSQGTSIERRPLV